MLIVQMEVTLQKNDKQTATGSRKIYTEVQEVASAIALGERKFGQWMANIVESLDEGETGTAYWRVFRPTNGFETELVYTSREYRLTEEGVKIR